MTPSGQATKEKLGKSDFLKTKNSCVSRDTVKKGKRPAHRESLSANCVSDKDLLSEMCKELLQLKDTSTNNSLNKGSKDIAPEKTYGWPVNT